MTSTTCTYLSTRVLSENQSLDYICIIQYKKYHLRTLVLNYEIGNKAKLGSIFTWQIFLFL